MVRLEFVLRSHPLVLLQGWHHAGRAAGEASFHPASSSPSATSAIALVAEAVVAAAEPEPEPEPPLARVESHFAASAALDSN